MAYEVHADGILVSDDRSRLDFAVIHDFLSSCYWSTGISMEQVERQTAHSTLAFGLYSDGDPRRQLGFARVLSDLTRFAYLCDVFVVSEAQGRGLGKRLMRDIKAHPELRDVHRWLLATKDAHGLYAQFGFAPLPRPQSWMSVEPDKARPRRWV